MEKPSDAFLLHLQKIIENGNFGCTEAIISICYSDPISAVPTNEQLLSEKKTGEHFKIDSLKTEGLVCIYTDKRTDKRAWLNHLSSSC